MKVELGNPAPYVAADSGIEGPAVTYVQIPTYDGPNGEPLYDVTPGLDAKDLALHLAQRPDGITNLSGHEALMSIVHTSGGLWQNHGEGAPSWVHVTADEYDDPAKAAELERQIADYYNIPRGRPDDVEMTHNTYAGPPGVGPDVEVESEAPALQVAPTPEA